ncbi:MAG: aminotransferase class I/II-fold pyridoxal phosphate-dependent enzyme [Gammaproteobacteria bacterium]
MNDITRLDNAARRARREELGRRYDAFKARGLALDMTRGKPSPEQLDLSLPMLDCVTSRDWRGEGDDPRNYGGLDGIPEAKRLFAQYFDTAPEQVIVGGNSSLTMMHAVLRNAMLHGVPGGSGPWSRQPKIKFLCPSPGYDRHFTICEYFGIEMIPVPMDEHGPRMDAVEPLVAADESIRGMWCVPKYSNPTGATYSDAVVERLAAMPARAPDFRLMWDNAYAVHHLYGHPAPLMNVLDACARAGNADRAYVFGSTSKISFAGAGVAAMACSRANADDARKRFNTETIGPDKLNQLRHVRFFGDLAGLLAHMDRHAAIMRPRFEAVQQALERDLGGRNVARWSRPEGGYFVSVDLPQGCARRVVALAGEAGVKLTPAGSTWPLGRDPRDSNLRIAPSFPKVNDVHAAMELFCLCAEMAALDAITG